MKPARTICALLALLALAACGGGDDYCDSGEPIQANQRAEWHARCDPPASAASSPK